MNSVHSKGVIISIDVTPDPLYYRIKLESNSEKPIEFNESTFSPPRWGIAPYGARIIIRDRNDKYVYLGKGGDFSSNDSGFELFGRPPDKWRLLKPKQTWISEWFSLLDVTYGFAASAAEKDPNKWKDFKILFWIEINKNNPEVLVGDSGWVTTNKCSLVEVMRDEKKSRFQIRVERGLAGYDWDDRLRAREEAEQKQANQEAACSCGLIAKLNREMVGVHIVADGCLCEKEGNHCPCLEEEKEMQKKTEQTEVSSRGEGKAKKHCPCGPKVEPPKQETRWP
ncbi:hypothetical protein [Ereboglobus sp. PH5-10]|uniref:hypothetical protein n=1 Tax=Ereboglobus sp. PH5-10 TaxID=2940629 RepID=UPI00240528CD|nr:hypothetical protein [Ereboglobus sp. PH5-10]